MNYEKRVLREALNRLVEDYDGEFADETIENPETGNEVKVATAMSYSDDHPAKKTAKKKIKKAKEKQDDDGGGEDEEESGGDEEKEEDDGAVDSDAKEEAEELADELGDVEDLDDSGGDAIEVATDMLKKGMDDPDEMNDMADTFEKIDQGFEDADTDNYDEYLEDMGLEKMDYGKAADNLKDAADAVEYEKEQGNLDDWKDEIQDHYKSDSPYKSLMNELYF